MRLLQPEFSISSFLARCFCANIFVFLLVALVNAQSDELGVGYQTAIEQVKSVTPEQCEHLFSEAVKPLEMLVPTEEENAQIADLVVEAVRRYCAAVSELELEDSNSLRSTGDQANAPAETTSLSHAASVSRLIGEAEYYIEIATQVDAEASNALLRRLLGDAKLNR